MEPNADISKGTDIVEESAKMDVDAKVNEDKPEQDKSKEQKCEKLETGETKNDQSCATGDQLKKPESDSDQVKKPESDSDQVKKPENDSDQVKKPENESDQIKKPENDSEEMKEEEDEEPESDLEILEDIVAEEGEDPSEIEVEKFHVPREQTVLNDIADTRHQRKVIIYPVKMSELNHPAVIDAISKATEFHTSYVHSKTDSDTKPKAWVGCLEMTFGSTLGAVEAINTLKTVREDLTVRNPGGSESCKLLEECKLESADSPRKLCSHILLVKNLTDNVTIAMLQTAFSGAADIVLPRVRNAKKFAYIMYEDADVMKETFEKYVTERPVIDEKKARVLLYDPSLELPSGLMKLRHRYRVLLQVQALKKAQKDKKANHSPRTIDFINTALTQCQKALADDEAAREKCSMKALPLSELRRMPKVRESIKENSLWVPGKSGEFFDFKRAMDEEREEDRRHADSDRSRFRRERDAWPRERRGFDNRGSHETSSGGIPSLLSMGMTEPPFDPRVRAHAIAEEIAFMAASQLGGPPPMRGGPMVPRGLMRGGPPPPPGMMRGSFRGGRGGFNDGPPPGDFDGGFRGRRGFGRGGFGDGGFVRGGRGGYDRGNRYEDTHGDRGFSRGGYQRGRGGSRDDRSSSDRGGYNKRPRSPSRDYRDDSRSEKVPRKDSDTGSRWSNRQDQGRGGGRSYDNWNKPTGGDRSGGYSQGSYNQGRYNQPSQPAEYNQPAANTPAYPPAANAGYNQTAYSQQAAGYQQQANTAAYNQSGSGYDQSATYGQAANYNQAATAPSYGQPDAANAYQQAQTTPAAYSGYTQQPGAADYYQQSSAAAYTTGQQTATGQAATAQAWAATGTAPQQQQQQPQQQQQQPGQYWSAEQAQNTWPTAATGADANTAAATYNYNWAAAAGGWK